MRRDDNKAFVRFRSRTVGIVATHRFTGYRVSTFIWACAASSKLVAASPAFLPAADEGGGIADAFRGESLPHSPAFDVKCRLVLWFAEVGAVWSPNNSDWGAVLPCAGTVGGNVRAAGLPHPPDHIRRSCYRRRRSSAWYTAVVFQENSEYPYWCRCTASRARRRCADRRSRRDRGFAVAPRQVPGQVPIASRRLSVAASVCAITARMLHLATGVSRRSSDASQPGIQPAWFSGCRPECAAVSLPVTAD